MQKEIFFVFEWGSCASEPNIIGWFKQEKRATQYYEDCIKEVNKNREANAGTVYAICRIIAQFEVSKP